jgi:hypothetical protein
LLNPYARTAQISARVRAARTVVAKRPAQNYSLYISAFAENLSTSDKLACSLLCFVAVQQRVTGDAAAAVRGSRHTKGVHQPMLKMLILVCAVGTAPADCRPQSALDIISGPDVASPVMCGLHGQAYIAETALATRGHDDEYLKIVCVKPSAKVTTGAASPTATALAPPSAGMEE